MNEQETSADIIAEMRGARTEFPFVYLIGEPDTPEVIELRTKKITEPRKINIRRVTVKELADRFEAARKRERGNFAALREALKLCMDEMCNRCRDLASARGNPLPCLNGCEPVRKAKAALAAPPRNCDLPKVVEDPWRAWLDDKSNWEDGNPKLEIHDWLLAPETEKKGENNGNE